MGSQTSHPNAYVLPVVANVTIVWESPFAHKTKGPTCTSVRINEAALKKNPAAFGAS
jgi:hypothetical protein